MKKIFQFAILAAVACGLAACSGNGGGSSIETETLTSDYANLRLSVNVPKDKGYQIVQSDALSDELKEFNNEDYNLYLVTDKAAFFFGEGYLSFESFADWKAMCKEKYDAQTGYFNTYEELQIGGREAVKYDKWEEEAVSYQINTDDFSGQSIGSLKIVALQGKIDEVLADEEVKVIFDSIKFEEIQE
jgi:hypothetical protein